MSRGRLDYTSAGWRRWLTAPSDPLRGPHGVRRIVRRPHVGVLLVVVGSAITGAALGHLAWPPQITTNMVVVSPETAGSAAAAAAMPDVEGLDEPAARAVLADAGYPTAAISTITKAAAGPPGRVIAQQPAAGAAPGPKPSVTLTLTRSVPMPNMVGQQREQAARTVSAMYAAARIELISTADRPAGTVIGTVPKAGTAMPAEITLQVSDGGTPVPLSDFSPVDQSRCSRAASDQTVNGTTFSTAFSCRPYPSGEGAAYLEYVLGRHATYLELTAGTADQAPATTSRVQVLVDGTAARTYAVTRGKASPIRVAVTGALRVRIEVSTSDAQASVVLGDARVVGSAAEMDRLLS